MAVPITNATTSFEFGQAKALFKMRMLPTQSVIRDYDISPDGQRFLIGTALGDARDTPATIILNGRPGWENNFELRTSNLEHVAPEAGPASLSRLVA
jgi:hypothetical protein